MEFEIGSAPKYENIRSHASCSRRIIDTRRNVDISDVGIYGEHIKDCIKHPTVGFLAKKEYISKKPVNHPVNAILNKSLLELHPKIIRFQKRLNATLARLYPKTKHIREYIIDHERVVLDTVKPTQKYSTMQKLMIVFKKFV